MGLSAWPCKRLHCRDDLFANVPATEEPLAQVAEPVTLPDLQDAILLDDSALLHDFLPLSRKHWNCLIKRLH